MKTRVFQLLALLFLLSAAASNAVAQTTDYKKLADEAKARKDWEAARSLYRAAKEKMTTQREREAMLEAVASVEKAEKEEARERELENLAAGFAQKSLGLLHDGDRTGAFRLAAFAHRFIYPNDQPSILDALFSIRYQNDFLKKDEPHRPWAQEIIGHQANVKQLDFSTDNQFLYSLDAENMLFVWDLDKLKPVYQQKLRDSILEMKALPTFGQVVFRFEKEVQIFDFIKKNLLQVLPLPSKNWEIADISKTNEILLRNLDFDSIAVWRWREVANRKQPKGYENPVFLKNQPDLADLRFGEGDDIWELTRSGWLSKRSWKNPEAAFSTKIECAHGDSTLLFFMAKQSNEPLIASMHVSDGVVQWVHLGRMGDSSFYNFTERKRLVDGEGADLANQINGDGDRFLTHFNDGRLRIYDMPEENMEEVTFEINPPESYDLQFCLSPNGERVALFSPYSSKIQFYELLDDESRLDFYKPRDLGERTALLPQSDLVVQVSPDFVCFENFLTHERDSIRHSFSQVLDLQRMFLHHEIALKKTDCDTFCFFNPSAKTVHEMVLKMGYSMRLSPDEQFWLMKESRDSSFWTIFSTKRAASAEPIKIGLVADFVQISPDNHFLAAVDGENLRIYPNWQTGSAENWSLFGHQAEIYVAQFGHQKSSLLASGDYDGSIKIWDLARRIERFYFHETNSPITHLAFSDDDKLLVAHNQDGHISIFDVETGEKRLGFVGDKKNLQVLSFSPDGKRLYAQYVQGDGTFLYKNWVIDIPTLIHEVERDNPNLAPLTPAQFREFGIEKAFVARDGEANIKELGRLNDLPQLVAGLDFYAEEAKSSSNLETVGKKCASAMRIYEAVRDTGVRRQLRPQLASMMADWSQKLLLFGKSASALDRANQALGFEKEDELAQRMRAEALFFLNKKGAKDHEPTAILLQIQENFSYVPPVLKDLAKINRQQKPTERVEMLLRLLLQTEVLTDSLQHVYSIKPTTLVAGLKNQELANRFGEETGLLYRLLVLEKQAEAESEDVQKRVFLKKALSVAEQLAAKKTDQPLKAYETHLLNLKLSMANALHSMANHAGATVLGNRFLEKSIEYYDQMTAKDWEETRFSGKAAAQSTLANNHFLMGDFEKAAHFYQKSIESYESQPSFKAQSSSDWYSNLSIWNAYSSLADVYLAANKPDEAERSLEKVAELQGDSAQILTAKARVALLRNDLPKALDFYRAALPRLDSTVANRQFYAIDLLPIAEARKSEAKIVLLKIFKGLTNETAVNYQTAFMKREAAWNRKEYALAAQFYVEEVRLLEKLMPPHDSLDWQSTYSNALGSAAWALLLKGDAAGSENMARKALTVAPAQFWIKANLAHALLFQGKTGEAMKFYDEIVENWKSNHDKYGGGRNGALLDFFDLSEIGMTRPEIPKIFLKLTDGKMTFDEYRAEWKRD